MGGCGTGNAFKRNCEDLNKAVLPEKLPVLKKKFLGASIKAPFFIAPVTGAEENFGGYLSNQEYCFFVAAAAKKLGIIPFFGDGHEEIKFMSGIHAAVSAGIKSCFIIKPWADRNLIREKIRLAESAGALAVGCDVDACYLLTMTRKNSKLSELDVNILSELISFSKVPFIVKGIMDSVCAVKAVDAGAGALVVSNHGGRVNDSAPSSFSVLPEIAEAVSGRVPIIFDGGIRTCQDYQKALSAGADYVMAARPVIHGAMRNGSSGIVAAVNLILGSGLAS